MSLAQAALGVLGLAVTGWFAYLAAKQTGKAQTTEAVAKVDQGRVTEWQALFAETRANSKEAVEESQAARREAFEARRESASLRGEVRILRMSLADYENRVNQLEQVLRNNGIPVPPWPSGGIRIVPAEVVGGPVPPSPEERVEQLEATLRLHGINPPDPTSEAP